MRKDSYARNFVYVCMCVCVSQLGSTAACCGLGDRNSSLIACLPACPDAHIRTHRVLRTPASRQNMP